ncbi:hypothetical protein IFM89_011350 [Coptis chinensis]|uniref:Uncharacterized protein n=1 Tax=Coptis chinensis TaxID=261450 RepID=A0A835HLR4_9MAGN|nr:hypothetical protein IFM89_011350 [Coptis chinensis]
MGASKRSSSSGEEDGDAEWKAAIDSVAANSYNTSTSEKLSKSNGVLIHTNGEDEENSHKPRPLKHYQIKAQKMLDEILEKSLVVANDPVPASNDKPVVEEDGIRLFRRAPPGIVDPIVGYKHVVETILLLSDELLQPRKRPKILPGEVADEKSKKFRRQLQSIVVDGMDIMASARDACQKSLARFQAKDAAAKAATKKEEERVAELKKIRGEKWLPSIAKEMQPLGSFGSSAFAPQGPLRIFCASPFVTHSDHHLMDYFLVLHTTHGFASVQLYWPSDYFFISRRMMRHSLDK